MKRADFSGLDNAGLDALVRVARDERDKAQRELSAAQSALALAEREQKARRRAKGKAA